MELPSLGRKQQFWLKMAGYALFFLASFFLMCWLLFPFNRWKGTLEEALSRQLDRKVTIGSVGSWGLTGLRLRDVTITPVEDVEDVEEGDAPAALSGKDRAPGSRKAGKKKGKEKKRKIPLHLDKLGLRLGLLAVVTGKVGVCFDAKLFDGSVKGCYVDASRSLWGGSRKSPPSEDGPRSKVKVKIRGVDLARVDQIKDIIGLPFHGIVEGDVKLSYVAGLPRTADGDVELRIENLRIGEPGGKIDLSKAGGVLQGEITFEPVVVGDLALDMKGEGGKLVVDRLEASSAHVEIKGGGDVMLRQPMMMSGWNIYVMFKFLPAYTDKSSMTKTIFSALDRLPKMRKAKRPDGFFGYLLKGDFKSGLKPIPSRSGPSAHPEGVGGGSKSVGKGLPMGLGSKSRSKKAPAPPD